MTVLKVNIDKETGMIKVYNNGKGIPIVEHKDEKMYVPTLIFGHLLTSSNYNDDEKKVTGNFGHGRGNVFYLFLFKLNKYLTEASVILIYKFSHIIYYILIVFDKIEIFW